MATQVMDSWEHKRGSDYKISQEMAHISGAQLMCAQRGQGLRSYHMFPKNSDFIWFMPVSPHRIKGLGGAHIQAVGS